MWFMPAYAGSTPGGGSLVLPAAIISAYAGSTCGPMTVRVPLRGSSPHTRGAPEGANRLHVGDGDHPRIRGEHVLDGAAVGAVGGIIPAYAGSTLVLPRSRCQSWGSSPHTRGAPEGVNRLHVGDGDHPRIRGEHVLDGAAVGAVGGIIPAYAGSTLVLPRSRCQSWGSSPHTRGAQSLPGARQGGRGDHPRIRGEHAPCGQPHVVRLGIIPAYAGSTTPLDCHFAAVMGSSPHTRGARPDCFGNRRRSRDHPRIRGEHGKELTVQAARFRIIPAYAGSAVTTRYPHDLSSGSSPHTRGARTRTRWPPTEGRDHPRIRGERATSEARSRCRWGIIPAYAGSALARRSVW